MKQDFWKKGMVITVLCLCIGIAFIPLVSSSMNYESVQVSNRKDDSFENMERCSFPHDDLYHSYAKERFSKQRETYAEHRQFPYEHALYSDKSQPLSTQATSEPDFENGTTWYVDDDGGADFTSIQEAINAANPGDTVFVYSGFYQENLVVNTSIILEGEDKETTIIDGDEGTAVNVDANWVRINSFTIQNGIYGINLRYSTDNTISGNTMDNNTYGIWLDYSPDSMIIDNVFHLNGIRITGDHLEHWNSHIIENNSANNRPIRYYKNAKDIVVPSDSAQVILANCTGFIIQDLNLSNVFSGIQLGYSSDNAIAGNTITDNYWFGIRLDSSSHNTITGNTINNNWEGIWLVSSSDNTISGNTITDNSDGIYLYSSSDNTITENTINNNLDGIYLYSSSDNTITENTINNNRYGIWLVSSTDNTITENTITDNRLGIRLADSSDNNIISGNTITDNYGSVIKLYFSSGNTITGNTITNHYEGILLWSSSDTTITKNIITDNNRYGILLWSSSHNTITDNTINNSEVGITLEYGYGSSSDTTITENTISNTIYGIFLHSDCNHNVIYYNNFIDNDKISVDEGNNMWDNGYVGNYWSDYRERYPEARRRLFRPLIWNSPYAIPGGDNFDRFPLSIPYSEDNLFFRLSELFQNIFNF